MKGNDMTASQANPRVAKGLNGQIEFDGRSVQITRKGLLAFASQGLKGGKQIPVKAITSVQFKKAGNLVNGYIQFATGAGEGRGGINQATSDENTVMFKLSAQSEFEELREAVIEAMHAPSENTQSGDKVVLSTVEQIEKLSLLLEKGILSRDEFDSEKRKLLS
jgi:hypothetical protein